MHRSLDNIGEVPSADAAEWALVRALLVPPNEKGIALASSAVQPGDFYNPVCRIVFEAILDVVHLGRPVDKISVCQHLAEVRSLDKVGGVEVLSLDRDTYVDEPYVTEWIREIKETARQRTIISANASALERLENGAPFVEAYGPLASALDELADSSGRALPSPLEEAALGCGPYEPPEFHVDSLLPEDKLVLLSGDTTSGKSVFAAHCLVARALALPVAGFFRSRNDGRPSIYLSHTSEMDKRQVKDMFRQSAAGLGVELPEKGLLIVANADADVLDLHPDSRRGWVAIEGILKDRHPAIIVLDSFRGFFGIDENNAQEVRRCMGRLKALASKYHVTVLVLHHLRKVGDISNRGRERVAGSRDLVNACDVHVHARSSGGFMDALLLDKTRCPSGAVTQGTKWTVTGTWLDHQDGSVPKSIIEVGVAEGGAHESKVDSAQRTILDALAGGPQTKEQLDAEDGTGERALRLLIDAGRVRDAGQKRGRKRLYELVPGVGEHPESSHDVV